MSGSVFFGIFYNLGLFFPGLFCLGLFCLRIFYKLGLFFPDCFVWVCFFGNNLQFGTVFSRTVLSGTVFVLEYFTIWDCFFPGLFCLGLFCLGIFYNLELFSPGLFCLGLFLSGNILQFGTVFFPDSFVWVCFV